MERNTAVIAMLFATFTAAQAGEADIESVNVRAEGGGNYTFSVTVSHGDTGWEHYADAFEILTPDGTSLGTRVLLHPHVNEQPFTRSIGGVSVPAGLTSVVVRAKDNLHGHGGKTLTIDLPDR